MIATVRVVQAHLALASNLPLRATRCVQVAVGLLDRGGDEDQLFFVRARAAAVYKGLGQIPAARRLLEDCLRAAVVGRRFFPAGWALLQLAEVVDPSVAGICLAAANRVHRELSSQLKRKAAEALKLFSASHPEFDVDAVNREMRKQALDVVALAPLEWATKG
jgi:hypothetical protein